MKYFSKLVYFFLTIGSNTERRKSKIDYGNLAMIVFYFIQLLGYLYSQFESKRQVFYENDYLAQIGQYSSIPFMMIVIHYDPFTILVYYCIFGTMCTIYGIIIYQILYKPFPPSNAINRFIKFYFQNFQWYFLTPFHECMIGVLTCGKLSYLAQHADLDPKNCFTEISPHFLVISLLGQSLVIISGFLSLYCFRNYEFIQGDLMRKFSFLNFLTILLHMVLQMTSFWKEMYDNYNIIIHMVFNLIMIIISIDTYFNCPFGYSFEMIYFSKCLISSSFFEILVAIWIFSDLDDGIIFLSFCIIVPLIFGINQAIYDNYIDNKCQQFLKSKKVKISEHPLEVICQLCHQETNQQSDYFIAIKYLEIHCQNCSDLICPCKQKINKFIFNQSQLSTNQIYLWVQYEFQQMIKSIMQNPNLFKQFEQLTIKFVTFLQKYRENQVLCYKIIQDVIYTFQKMNSGSTPYFFLNLAKHIQYKNKVEMENMNKANSQISQHEYLTLQEFNIFYRYEQSLVRNLNELLVRQKQLWIEKLRNQIELEKILNCSEDILKKTLNVKKIINTFEKAKDIPKIDSILNLRIKLVSSLVCMEDINVSMKIARQIENYEKELINQKQQTFNTLQFIYGQALSVISNISSQTLGCICQQVNDQFCNFFGYESNYGASLTKLEQLLPSKLGKIHNGLIESYLQSGKSIRLYQNSDQFIINYDNLIEKVNICLSTLFPFQNGQYQFLVIGHLLKLMKYEKKEIDYNKKGYILVDSNFLVFGMSRNVYERINYKYFYKNEKDIGLIIPEEIYDQYTIQTFIPQLSLVLEEYYKILSLKNEKRILKHDIICQREIGVFQAPSLNRQEYKTNSSLLTKKITNKHMMNILKDVNFSLANIPTFSQKQYPIEYSVTQKVLNYVDKDGTCEFLYFIIEIDFLEDPKVNTTPSQIIPRTPALSEILRRQQFQLEQSRPNQSNIILSNDDNNNDQIELVAELTNTGTRRSSNEIIDQLEKIIIYINDTLLPKSIKGLIAQLFLQILILFAIIVILSNIFQYKKSIQSDCIEQITYDLNFLDAYSQAMSGSRHVIYYRDFYSLQKDTLINFNPDQLNFSRYDKIYVAWQHISKGNIRLNNMYENYTKIAQKSDIKLLTINFVNFDLKSKIQQVVQDYSTYYQIMHQTFYLQYQSFSISPQIYLSGNNDSYLTQLARSQVYYNFFDVIESANLTLQDCQSQNNNINNYFDTVIIFYFLAMYIVIVLILISIIIHYFRVLNSIKIYIKLFKMCDKEDCQHIIHLCESLLSMVNYDKIFLRQQDFKIIMAQPRHIIDNVKKSQSKTTIVLIRKKRNNERLIKTNQNKSSYYSIIMLILISIALIIYILSFNLYYNFIKDSIAPIRNQAILAQEQRLNFIASVNRFDLYLIKLYFETYSKLNQINENYQFTTKNIQTDTQILKLLTIDNQTLEQDLYRLKQINFVNLIFDNDQTYSQMDNNQQNQMLKNDVCIFTGCNMETELFFDRLFQNELVPLFQTGVLNLHTKILALIQDAFQVILPESNNQEIIMTLQDIFEDSDYLIYMHWGLDVIQYQISQFCQHFLNISQQTIQALTKNNQVIIISIGILLLFLISIFSMMFVNFQYKRFVQSKAIIKQKYSKTFRKFSQKIRAVIQLFTLLSISFSLFIIVYQELISLMISRIFEYLLRISLTDNMKNETNLYFPETIILWIYFGQLNGFLINKEDRNFTIFQENQYLYAIFDYANIVNTLSQYINFEIMAYFIILQLIIFYVFNFTLMMIKQHIYIVSIYFILFNWIMMCPFQTIFIMVTTKREFNNQVIYDISSNGQIFFLVIFLLGTTLIFITSTLSNLIFKKREIYQKMLLKYDFKLAYSIGPLTQLYIIVSYMKQNQQLIIVTHILHFLIMSIQLIIAFQFPFGLTSTSLLFNQLTIISIFFNCLIFIWKQSSHSDQFIFLSLLIIGMLLWYSVQLLFYRRLDKIVNNFCSKRETLYLAEVLEYFIQTHSYTFSHLLQLNIHRINCQDLLCPCSDCLLLAIDNVSIAQLAQQQSKKKKFIIQKWLVYQYQIYLQRTDLQQKQNDLIIFNYISFQQNFLENHVLTCLTIYQCIQKVEQVRNQKYNATKTLLYLIQQKCKQKLIMQTQQQKKITQQEFLIITDINIMYELADKILQQLQKVLQQQIFLWVKYSKNEIKNFDQLLKVILNIKLQKKNSKDLFEEYKSFRTQSKDTIYSLRVKLLFYLIVQQDFLLMTKIQSQLMQLEDSQRFELNVNDFNNLSFLTGQALSIISNISHENQGKLEHQITNEFKQFFGYANDEKKLTHIKQLMPSKIAEVHSGLVENFFIKGQSDRINNISIAFILNSKNLIEQIKLCLSYYFPVDLRDTSFYMIAHIQKTQKQEKNLHDDNLIGHLLVGEDFNVFGMTQNIYEKLNYRFFFKNDANAIVKSPQEFYNEHNIFQLIPSFQFKLQNYYQGQPNRKLKDNEIILNKERGLLKLDFHKSEQENSAQKHFGQKFSFSHLTSKQILSQMMNTSGELINLQTDENVKYFPIEYTVTQKILHFSNLNNKIDQFLYYLIEIQMVEDFQKMSDLNKSTNRFLKNKMKIIPQKIETQRQSIDQQLQFEAINFVTSDRLISQFGDKEALAKEFNQEKSRSKQKLQSFSKGVILIQNDAQSQKSSIMNLPNRVNKFFQFLQTNKYPSIFLGMIGFILINFIIVIFSTSFTTILFYQKKEIQSDCIIYTFHDVDYFNGFSLILSGSRHTIFNSNYLNVLEPLIFRVDNQIIKLTSKDCIIISWHLLLSGQQDLVGKYENYSQILLKYEQKQITFYYPDYSNSQILSQILLDQATYYTTMYLQFYFTYKSILSLNAYLSGGNDNIFLVRNRYILYFNYQDAIEITKDSIQSCYDYNNDANKYFDLFCSQWFIAMYIVTIFIFICQLLAAHKIKKVTQIFLKQFIQIDFEESQTVIKQFENILQILNQENILFKYQEFQIIKQMPSNIFQVLQKQQSKLNLQEENEINNSQKKRSTSINTKKINFTTPNLSVKKFIFLYIFLMLLKITFLAVFQYYYDYLSLGIAPSAKRELQSQKMRLDFIMTINMWDTYLLKEFYNASQNLVNPSSIFSYSNQNVRNNQKLLNQLKIDKDTLLEKINAFQTIDLTDFLYHNADEQNQNLLISEQDKQILLGQDVCYLTGCDMIKDLFQNRPNTEYLIEYYQVGLIQLFKNVFQVIVEYNYLITDESLTPEQKVQGIIQMYQSFNYFLYIFYGLDAIQFQISQFCQYFLDQTLYTLEHLTSSNIAYVTTFGILLFIITICIECYIFFCFLKKFELARETIKSIPLEILFLKNIPKKLNNIMIKYN